MRTVLITREPVELYKILKFEGLVDNGGAAKAAIEQGLVSVNGEVETRKRKQIVAGDVIGFASETFCIARGEASGSLETKHPSTKRRARFPGRAAK
jgi:ribosome-associated protein